VGRTLLSAAFGVDLDPGLQMAKSKTADKACPEHAEECPLTEPFDPNLVTSHSAAARTRRNLSTSRGP